MHKIKVEQNSLHLKEEEVVITEFLDSLKLIVSGTVYCAIPTFQSQTLEIVLEENSHLTLEFFLELQNTKNKICILNGENSQLDLHYSCKYSGENEFRIENRIKTNHNRNVILIRGVDNEGTLFVHAVGDILEDTKDNAYLEDIKVITSHQNSIKIKPDLKVSSNAVLASHNATIGPIEENELFYLESKGLDEATSSSLIKDGFLKGIINEEVFKDL